MGIEHDPFVHLVAAVVVLGTPAGHFDEHRGIAQGIRVDARQGRLAADDRDVRIFDWAHFGFALVGLRDDLPLLWSHR